MYQLTPDSNVVKRVGDDGAALFIPNDEGNRDWQGYQSWLADGNTPTPVPTPPVPVPSTVTRYQARAALLDAGLLQQVNDHFATLLDDDRGKLAWLEAPTVERTSPWLIDAAHALGLSDETIDQLFIAAAAVQ